MKNSQNNDIGLLVNEINSIGKTPDECTPDIFINDRMDSRIAQDMIYCIIQTFNKFESKTGYQAIIP